MARTIRPSRRITGEVVVPGEVEPAAQALVLAAAAEGKSQVRNAPPGVASVVRVLRRLGVGIKQRGDVLEIHGEGLQGFRCADGLLELDDWGDAALLLVALLAVRGFSTRVRLRHGRKSCRELLKLLRPMGAVGTSEGDGVFVVGGAEKLVGIRCGAVDPDSALELGVLVAGLRARGVTTLQESRKNRDQAVSLLRTRKVAVERQKERGTGKYLLSVEGNQTIQPLSVQVAGDLDLTFPLIAAALVLKDSQLKIRRVALRAHKRAFLDLLRQLGGQLDLQENGDGTTDVLARSGELKSTRVAAGRMEKVVDKVALLAVLATQTRGEFVIRDMEALRLGDYDRVAYLANLLRQINARVGEFSEGLVVKGGVPLRGVRVDCREDPGLAQAFTVAGLLAENEMELEGTGCMDRIYPEFFAVINALKEERR